MPDTTAAREPLVTTASLVALVTGLFSLAAYLGLHIDPQAQAAALRAVPVVATLAPIAVAFIARRHVTPLADPRGADGAPLVPRVLAAAEQAAVAIPASGPETTIPDVGVATRLGIAEPAGVADPTPAPADPAP